MNIKSPPMPKLKKKAVPTKVEVIKTDAKAMIGAITNIKYGEFFTNITSLPHNLKIS